jgi:protoporphyrinogen oxidase
MPEKIKEIVISKDEAVFWLDKNGYWHNRHGKFQHKKIIDYFHSSIKRDRSGYFLSQENGTLKEKVYFHHEDTALFVFDVIKDNDIILALNTKRKIKLDPEKLFMRNDNLYVKLGDETIKFAEQALLKIADLLEDESNQYFIRVNDRKYKIPSYQCDHKDFIA